MCQFESEKSKEMIFVASIDFDGCSDTAQSREAIIEHIAQSCRPLKNLKQITLMIGSLRQSVLLDIINAKHHSRYPNFISCISMIEHLEAKLQETFPDIHIATDTYLLFDSFQQLEHGTTYKWMQKVFKEIDQELIHHYDGSPNTKLEAACFDQELGINFLTAKHFLDNSKTSIIYAQLHHIASQYPEQQIIMHFYDDKTPILENLRRFYYGNVQWIPTNLSLNLFKQQASAGFKPLKASPNLIGQGPVNTNYHHHLLKLAVTLNWQGTPQFIQRFEQIFQHIFPTINAPKTLSSIAPLLLTSPYDSILIPNIFSTDIEKTEFIEKAWQEAENIYEQQLTSEKNAFLEFKASLNDYKDYKENYQQIYQIFKLKQLNPSPKIEMKIQELESILSTNLSEKEYEDIIDEAENYAQGHCIYDERISNCTKVHLQFIHDLKEKVSKVPVEEVRFFAPTAIKPNTYQGLTLFRQSLPFQDASVIMKPK